MKEKEMGKGVLFLKEDVKRIIFLQEEHIKGKTRNTSQNDMWMPILCVICAFIIFLRILVLH
jgi:hypothetical protein